eukprot:GHVQ01028770.1.p1 GENE.GHVQ01028770.1~~GHVQ01028770.1.p1  ORF type:complete len:238 (-),score=27.02 GHVQ01028770.1:769-1482(-)
MHARHRVQQQDRRDPYSSLKCCGCTSTYQENMSDDLRGFLIVFNEDVKKFLLLQCDRKPKKGVHYQLPGGRYDAQDEVTLREYMSDRHIGTFKTDPDALARFAAIRELREETGIDLSNCPHRLISLSSSISEGSWPAVPTVAPLKGKHFFVAVVSVDWDGGNRISSELCNNQLEICLTKEHSDFIYVDDLPTAATLVSMHSQGDCTRAVHQIVSKGKWNELYTAGLSQASCKTAERS